MKIKTTIRFGLSDSRFADKAHATDWVSSELVDWWCRRFPFAVNQGFAGNAQPAVGQISLFLNINRLQPFTEDVTEASAHMERSARFGERFDLCFILIENKRK